MKELTGTRRFYASPFRTMDGLTICRVDGAKIRSLTDTEFLLGTNGYASRYVPKDEVWVDKTLSGKDLDAIIIHEVYEALLMSRGMSYEKAHKKALALERSYRKTGTLVNKASQRRLHEVEHEQDTAVEGDSGDETHDLSEGQFDNVGQDDELEQSLTAR